MLAEAQVPVCEAEVGVPLTPTRQPFVEETWRVIRTAEVLHLHLLELARAEDEVPRRDLVAERLPDLRDAERDPLRSEEHTSELQSLAYLVCRLLLEKKNKHTTYSGA